MDWITGIQKAIDYIEAHLTEEIDYEKIAAESFSSSYHFQRIFSILCGYTIGEYVRFRRLSVAGAELANGKEKVIDIALKYGYESPDSFSKAFQKFHGVAPSKVRAEGVVLKSFSRLYIKISLEGGSTMHYKIEEKQAFYVLEKVERFTVENGANYREIPKFWDRANADGTVDKLIQHASDSTFVFGICYGTTTKSDPTFEYSIAVECMADAPVPEGFRKTQLPARTWVVFGDKGKMPDAIQSMWKKIITEFFPTSEYVSTREFDIEAYPDGDTNSPDYYSEIWVPIEKK